MTPQDRLIANAEEQVGYFGKATNANLDIKAAPQGYGLYNKFARDLDAVGDWFNGRKNGFDWCDVFSDWNFYKVFGVEMALKLICQPKKSLGAGCKYSMGYYKSAGRFYTKNPQKGDQIFFYNTKNHNYIAHTGLVSSVDSKYVYTIEGNAGYPSCVRKCRYLLTYAHIAGYGRPKYELVKDEQPTVKPDPKPENPKEEVSFLSDAELFEKMYKNMMQKYNDNDASAWSEDAREWVTENGIVTGVSNNNMAWESIPTREQFSVMLKRYNDNVVEKKLDEIKSMLQQLLDKDKT